MAVRERLPSRSWLGGHAALVAEDGTKLGERTLLFPREAAEIVPVWQVIGLRGTGSDTFRATDLFVPEAFGLLRDQPEERRLDAPLYRFTTNAIYGASFAPFPSASRRRCSRP